MERAAPVQNPVGHTGADVSRPRLNWFELGQLSRLVSALLGVVFRVEQNFLQFVKM